MHLTSCLNPGKPPGRVGANAVLWVGVRGWVVAVDAGGGLSGGRGWDESPRGWSFSRCFLLLRVRHPSQMVP